MAFTTTTGANGVVSLVGTSGVDADAAITYSSLVSIEGFGDNDLIGVAPLTGQQFVSEFTIIGGQGNDTIDTRLAAALVNSTVWGDNIETVDGEQIVGSGDDLLFFAGIQNSTVLGLGGKDTIVTGDLSGADINGNQGIDDIDVLANLAFDPNALGVTNSFVRAGQDDDFILVNAFNLVENHINGNKGSDFIEVIAGAIVAGAGQGVLSGTTVYGGQGSDTIRVDYLGAGTSGFTLSGDLGNDDIEGSAVNDTITGGEGTDTLKGLGGKDTIDGGADIDTITGGLGADALTGGGGNDIFEQATGDSVAGTAVAGAIAGSFTFADGVDVIFDGTATDVINFDGGQTIKADYYRGTWDGTTFTRSAGDISGGAYLYNGAGLAGSASSFIVLGDIAAAVAP